ncbi:hypothetical protein [Liquorilactobacillus oeni]|uniref:Uncharacterized protein n=1 Tax=Liquorilactobacillus oeni DSM 19972 TaxID=1423777 RepID=A0A0R1MGK7_9LACO|nr:hypothetical protein [Liquorilactobacillus oeni]KRL04453.1 hypothetical protein FD46_GL001583 [Liquorilactobacillus oeni DSM 19972]
MTEKVYGERVKLAFLPVELTSKEYQIFKNPHVVKYTKHGAFKNADEALKFIMKHNQEKDFFGVYLKRTNELIGNC